MELLAGSARTPAFDEKEMARLRAERLNELLQEYADAGRRARHAFMPALYSPDSPYSRPAAGSLVGVGALTPGVAADYYRRFATPGSAALIVAGDVDAAAVEDLAAEVFGSWEGPEPERQAPPARPAAGARGCRVVHRPGSVQSHILAGHIGLPRRTEDFFPVTAMVTVLGGLFTSRINMRLREEKGYTYGARAAFDFRRQPGPFAVSTAVETSVTGPAVAEIAAELSRMRDGGVTEAELAEAKDYLVGVFPLAFETSDAIAGAVAHLVVYGLGLDHYDSYRETMAAVGVAEASEAARRRLDPEGLSVVVAGDAAAVEPQLAGLGLGPVAVVEDERGAAGA